MGAWKLLFCVACLTLQCHSSEAGALLDSEAILKFQPPPDDKDNTDIAIDELMPNGGEDEETEDDEEEAKTGEREDSDMIPLRGGDARFAPSDASFEHFSKMAPHEYRMEDVEEFERKYANGRDIRWPKATVPFEFSPGIQRRPTAYIYSAMKEWMEKTCVKFEPWTPTLAQELGHNQRVLIRNDKGGCHSMLGKVGSSWYNSGTSQDLNLAPNTRVSANLISGCEVHRIALHELGHSLGYDHEQQRPDRDNYVKIRWENLRPGRQTRYQFDKPQRPSLKDFTPYDYLSIMHYGQDFLGRTNWRGQKLQTMVAHNACYTNVMGKQKHLSYNDHKVMNTWYGCTKGCDASRCGRDCYSTRSGENGQCHCVCNKDNDPCKGSTGNPNGGPKNPNGGPKNPCTDKSYYCKNLSRFSCQYNKTFWSICCATCQRYKH